MKDSYCMCMSLHMCILHAKSCQLFLPVQSPDHCFLLQCEVKYSCIQRIIVSLKRRLGNLTKEWRGGGGFSSYTILFTAQVVSLWVISGNISYSVIVLYFIATSAKVHLPDSTSFLNEAINMKYRGLTH